MAKRWTQEEDELLLKLRKEGYTTKEMTVYLKHRTYAAIRSRVASIAPDNLNRPWTKVEKDLVLKLKTENKSTKYIARAVDRTPKAVTTFLSRHWNSIASNTSLETESAM